MDTNGNNVLLSAAAGIVGALIGAIVGGWIARSTAARQVRLTSRQQLVRDLIDTAALYQAATVEWVSRTTMLIQDFNAIMQSFEKSIYLKYKIEYLGNILGARRKEFSELLARIENKVLKAKEIGKIDLASDFKELSVHIHSLIDKEL